MELCSEGKVVVYFSFGCGVCRGVGVFWVVLIVVLVFLDIV